MHVLLWSLSFQNVDLITLKYRLLGRRASLRGPEAWFRFTFLLMDILLRTWSKLHLCVACRQRFLSYRHYSWHLLWGEFSNHRSLAGAFQLWDGDYHYCWDRLSYLLYNSLIGRTDWCLKAKISLCSLLFEYLQGTSYHLHRCYVPLTPFFDELLF